MLQLMPVGSGHLYSALFQFNRGPSFKAASHNESVVKVHGSPSLGDSIRQRLDIT